MSSAASNPSAPDKSSRPRRILPPGLARIHREGYQYTEWGDLAWKLFGTPDGELDIGQPNGTLTPEEFKETYDRMLPFDTSS